MIIVSDNIPIISVLISNYGDNVWREMRKIREVLYWLCVKKS